MRAIAAWFKDTPVGSSRQCADFVGQWREELLGVAPLHRAVRNRCSAAVRALIDGGADPRAPNRNGSTPLLLATQNTGRGGSGSAEAKAQQKEILRLLMEHGAT
jgi:hypothetical protein